MSRKTAQPKVEPTEVDPALGLKQTACIMHLCQGETQRAVAGLLSIDEATISRWKQDPAFLAALNAAQADVQAATVEKLRNLQTKALDTLADLLDSSEPRIKLSAASAILSRSGLTVTAPGSTDPADIELDQRAKIADRALKSMWAR